MPSASMRAVSSSGSTLRTCSPSATAPSRRSRRAAQARASPHRRRSRRGSRCASAKRASISASVIGAASRMRPCAAVPAISPTARKARAPAPTPDRHWRRGRWRAGTTPPRAAVFGDAVGIGEREQQRRREIGLALHHATALLPPPAQRRGGSGVGGRATDGNLPSTPDPSPPRAARAGGGERAADPSRCSSAICAQRFAIARASWARRERSRRRLSRRCVRSTSLPPRPRSVSTTAISAASSRRASRRRIDHHAREPRRQRQLPQRPALVGDAAVAVDRAELAQQRARLRPAPRAAADRGRRASPDRSTPQCARSSTRPTRSAARISGVLEARATRSAARPTADSRRRARCGRRGRGADRRRRATRARFRAASARRRARSAARAPARNRSRCARLRW